MKQYEFWLVAGTQTLYGDDVIRQVDEDAQVVCHALNDDPAVVGTVVYKGALVDSAAIERFVVEANSAPACAGIITWMHTFSPSKMWIAGLTRLQKPYLHFNTQFYRDIPRNTIDKIRHRQSAHNRNAPLPSRQIC